MTDPTQLAGGVPPSGDPGEQHGLDDAGGREDAAEAVRARARESLDHLQAAARELIHAARAALDAAERFIDDPEMMAVMASAAGRLGEVLRAAAPDRAHRGSGDGAATGDQAAAGGDGEPVIQRITVR